MIRVAMVTAALAAVAWAHRRARPTVSTTGAAPAAPVVDRLSATATRSKWSNPSRSAVMLLGLAIALQLIAGATAAVPLARPDIPAATPAVPAPPVSEPTADPATPVPVRIDIPRLAVSAPVDEIGLAGDGTVAVPEQFDRTGWYSGLETPGQVGTAVIVGHLDSYTGPAVFFKVPQLVAGDEILVSRADNSTVRFVVERTEQYDKRGFPTIAVYAPADRPVLRLITCGGTFDKKRRHYSDNVVVYASAQEAT